MLNTNEQNALDILGRYTRGRFDIYMLAGGQFAGLRSHVMSTLRGVRVPQAKAGITAIRQAFYQLGGITGTCLNDQEENFMEWAKAQASAPRIPTCQHCGSVLSAVTWTCVRGEHCPGPQGKVA